MRTSNRGCSYVRYVILNNFRFKPSFSTYVKSNWLLISYRVLAKQNFYNFSAPFSIIFLTHILFDSGFFICLSLWCFIFALMPQDNREDIFLMTITHLGGLKGEGRHEVFEQFSIKRRK